MNICWHFRLKMESKGRVTHTTVKWCKMGMWQKNMNWVNFGQGWSGFKLEECDLLRRKLSSTFRWSSSFCITSAASVPIGSMYAIYGNYHQYTPNVSIYEYIYMPYMDPMGCRIDDWGYLWTHPNVQLLDGYPEATCDGVVRTEHACWLCLLAFAPTGCPNL